MRKRRETEKKCIHSTRGLAIAQLPAFMEVGVLPRETGEKIFRFRHNRRSHTLLKTQTTNSRYDSIKNCSQNFDEVVFLC